MCRETAQTETEGDCDGDLEGQRAPAGEVPTPEDPTGAAPCGGMQRDAGFRVRAGASQPSQCAGAPGIWWRWSGGTSFHGRIFPDSALHIAPTATRLRVPFPGH